MISQVENLRKIPDSDLAPPLRWAFRLIDEGHDPAESLARAAFLMNSTILHYEEMLASSMAPDESET